MALGSTQPLTEMSTNSFSGCKAKRGSRLRLTISPLSVRRFSIKCVTVNVWQPYVSPRPISWIALSALIYGYLINMEYFKLFGIKFSCSLTSEDKKCYVSLERSIYISIFSPH
jgi:hypothetical protein